MLNHFPLKESLIKNKWANVTYARVVKKFLNTMKFMLVTAAGIERLHTSGGENGMGMIFVVDAILL